MKIYEVLEALRSGMKLESSGNYGIKYYYLNNDDHKIHAILRGCGNVDIIREPSMEELLISNFTEYQSGEKTCKEISELAIPLIKYLKQNFDYNTKFELTLVKTDGVSTQDFFNVKTPDGKEFVIYLF